ncbi:MAG TPA: non-heme iron oxygenase ferredoxin subunit [Candidatus Binatia bacterium]|nr:non-heme iron oxygenase ferredoxin subunit [Candidatus Binatia bacterium]
MGSDWLRVAPLRSLDAKYPTLARAGETEVALCLVGEAVYATENVCSHAFAKLSDGELDGYEIMCPLHGGRFDVRTGEPSAPPCIDPIAVFPTKVENGDVFVRL